jgi:hypothetical protein
MIKICPYCKKEFETENKRKKYCTYTHRENFKSTIRAIEPARLSEYDRKIYDEYWREQNVNHNGVYCHDGVYGLVGAHEYVDTSIDLPKGTSPEKPFDYVTFPAIPPLNGEAAIKFHLETFNKKITKAQEEFLEECKKLLKRRI